MKKYLFLLFVVLIAYGSSLKYGFSQDDFYHLILARADFISYLIPSDDWVFYRPLSTQVYYGLFFSIFRLDSPLYMHIFMLLLHAANAYLITRIVSFFTLPQKSRALLIGSLYALSGIHFLSLFYIGATQQILATFFSLLALKSYLSDRKITPTLWLIPALLSKEIVFRVLPIFFLLGLVRFRSYRKVFFSLLLPGTLFFIYIVLRLALGLGSAGEYHLSFAPTTTLATLMWYFLMTFGFPEHLLHYGLSGGLIDWVAYATSIGALTIANLLVALFSIIIFAFILLRRLINRDYATFLVTISLYLASLAPVIFLPTHRYSHYLDLGLIPLLYLLVTTRSKLITTLVTLALVIANLTSIAIDEKTHWTTARANIAQGLTSRVQSEGGCSHQVWYLSGNQDIIQQVEYALMYTNGPNIICNRSDIEFSTNYTYELKLSKTDLRQ